MAVFKSRYFKVKLQGIENNRVKMSMKFDCELFINDIADGILSALNIT